MNSHVSKALYQSNGHSISQIYHLSVEMVVICLHLKWPLYYSRIAASIATDPTAGDFYGSAAIN